MMKIKINKFSIFKKLFCKHTYNLVRKKEIEWTDLNNRIETIEVYHCTKCDKLKSLTDGSLAYLLKSEIKRTEFLARNEINKKKEKND